MQPLFSLLSLFCVSFFYIFSHKNAKQQKNNLMHLYPQCLSASHTHTLFWSVFSTAFQVSRTLIHQTLTLCRCVFTPTFPVREQYRQPFVTSKNSLGIFESQYFYLFIAPNLHFFVICNIQLHLKFYDTHRLIYFKSFPSESLIMIILILATILKTCHYFCRGPLHC